MHFKSLYFKLISLESLVTVYFFLLLLFGVGFSKFQVAGPIYLHDLFLGVITLLVINNRKKLTFRFKSIFLLISIALLYLVYSLIIFKPSGILLLMTFRQFNLFVYLFCSYIIFNTLVKKIEDIEKIIHLVKWIAFSCVIIQVLFVLYGYLFRHGFSLFSEGEYNYYSPLIIFGIISFGAYVLAYEQSTWKRYLKFIFCILLSTTVGHSSAFFALFIILMIHFFIKITPLQRLIAVGIIILAIVSLFFLPQFNDANASWRLLYWKHVLERLIKEKYFLFGFGFGQPYMTQEYAEYLNVKLNSPIMMDSYAPMARYLAPPHNSLLTIAFHVGILPMLLYFIPLKGYFKQIFFKQISTYHKANFFLYALTGSMVWICFNVILELPHTSAFFWLLYFSTAYYFNIFLSRSRKNKVI